MTKKTKISYAILFLTFIIALFLRFYRLGVDSPSIYTDEIGHYFVLNSLKEGGLGITRTLANATFTATWFLGMNPLGIRFNSALFGSLTVLAGFFFAKTLSKLSGSNLYLRVGLVFAALTAILPWNIAISRLGHTHVPLVVLLSMIHLILYLNAKNTKEKLASFIPFLICAYFYPNLIIMSPIILLLPVKEFIKSSSISKKHLYSAIGIFVLIVTLILVNKYEVLNKNSRGLDLAIWRDVNVTADSNHYRGLARLSTPSLFSFGLEPEKIANKLVFNYPISIFSVFTKNYLSFFSPDFLFLKGDTILRHSTSMVGNFYLFLLPFMLIGTFVFFRDQTSKNKIIFLTWILASPIPAAITKDGANYLLRAVTLMPFLTYFAALGIVTSFELIKNRLLKVFFSLAVLLITIFSSYYYFYGYFHAYSALSASSFEYGFKELAQFQIKSPGKMLVVWEDKYPFTYFCLWQNIPYSDCKLDKVNTRENTRQSRVDLPIPNLLFSLPKGEQDFLEIIKKYKPDFIALPNRYNKDFPQVFKDLKKVESINNPDNTTSFEIYKVDYKK